MESLNPAQAPTRFTAGEEIVMTLPASPYLSLSLFLSLLRQKPPPFFLVAVQTLFVTLIFTPPALSRWRFFCGQLHPFPLRAPVVCI